MSDRSLVDHGNDCSRELVLVLRRKAARLQARDPGQVGSDEPVPEQGSRGRGGRGRGRHGRGGGESSQDTFHLLPKKVRGIEMDAS
eukprot:15437663-Alexandrium_andersonii.AAC.1